MFRAVEAAVEWGRASLDLTGLTAIGWSYPEEGVGAWRLGVALALAWGVIWAALRMRPTQPILASGWLWFLATLLPVLGLVQVGAQSAADRYTYLPGVGSSLMAVWAMP